MKSKIKQLVADTKDSKPYNQCITCGHFGTTCGGANFLSMPIYRMGEWARIRKEYLGWTNEYIADQTGVSLGTVTRFLAGHTDDIKLTTVQAIIGLLSKDFCGSMPCYDFNSVEASSPIAELKIQYYERAISQLKEQLAEAKDEAQKKIDYLRADIAKKDALIEKLVSK